MQWDLVKIWAGKWEYDILPVEESRGYVNWCMRYCKFLISYNSASMAEGGNVHEYTKAIRSGSGYKNPWGDGRIPEMSPGALSSFALGKNRSNVPGEQVS